MKTDLKLVAKYLGFGNKQPDERTKHDMERIAAQFEQAITGKWTYGHYLLDHSVEGLITLEGTAVVLEGKSITRTLKRCKEVYIMVCTLGVQGDLLIERNKMMSPTLGMIADACASAFVETIADSCQQEIESQLPAGAALTFRYAPGYGDLPLATNKTLLGELQSDKRIGVHLTDSMLMTPRKSIVAILGVLEEGISKGKNHRCGNTSCSECDLKDSCTARS